jgi:hypothetical protein
VGMSGGARVIHLVLGRREDSLLKAGHELSPA